MTTNATMVSYPEMVGFLKGQRVAGIALKCKLNADYSTIRAEYERLLSVSEDESEEVVVASQCENLQQFTHIKVNGFPSLEAAEVQIDDEVRILDMRWDDNTNSGITIKKEVAVISSSDSISQKVGVHKLEIYCDSEGIYRAIPLCKQFGRVEWLYPDANTKITQIKAYINEYSPYKWIECQKTASPALVASTSVTCCREVFDNSLGITRRYPLAAQFTKIGKKWMIDGGCWGNIQWISIAQSCIQIKVGDTVYLQNEYGDANIAAFEVISISYNHLCKMASLRCINGNKRWYRGDTTMQPIVQLVECKKVKK